MLAHLVIDWVFHQSLRYIVLACGVLGLGGILLSFFAFAFSPSLAFGLALLGALCTWARV